MRNKLLDYYSTQSFVSNPGKYVRLYHGLPSTIPEITKVVQGLVIDKDLLDFYGEKITEGKKSDLDIRYVKDILQKMLQRDSRPLTQEREPANRFVGSCRDYAIILCSMLRHQNVPARLRVGFDRYFNLNPGFYDDHWVCEYWDKEKSGWVMVDANLDEIVIKRQNITVDPLDISHDEFVTAGEAWELVRNKEVDPDKFGVSVINIQGLWFIRGSIVRDLAALNKQEVLPWDYWGIADKDKEEFPEKDIVLLDKASQAVKEASSLEKLQSLFNNPSFSVPEQIKSYSPFYNLQLVNIRK